MKIQILIFILLSVTMSAIAQIVLKTGMSGVAITHAISSGSAFEIVLRIASNQWVIGGLSLYFLGAVVWLFVLARVDVGFAYPFVGLGFILTMLFGHLILGESISLMRTIGAFLVAIGVVLISLT